MEPGPTGTPATASAKFAALRARAERRLFWKGLYPHAVPFAPLLMIFHPRYFRPDRELIHGLANATTAGQVREEISNFILNPANGSWLRSQARIRVSSRRIEQYLRSCLGPDTPLPTSRGSRRVSGTDAPVSRRSKGETGD